MATSLSPIAIAIQGKTFVAKTAAAAVMPGLEFAAPENRMHYSGATNRFHLSAPENRMHLSSPEE